MKTRMVLVAVFLSSSPMLFVHADVANGTYPDIVASPQQSKKVTGQVSDDLGPVTGASVVVKGTTNGNITDMDGNFSLENVKNGDIIQVSFIGYTTQEITYTGQTFLRVQLKEDTQTLDEVVVVGFGTQKKVNLTGSVATVSSEALEARPVVNATQALQGLVPGLQITQTGGSLETTPNINVRGTTTIGEGSSGSPLVLIDGMEADINSVNPQDIENISVLKDAAASSIYGSRAPFGVILITTKSGKIGKTSVNYNNNFRISSPINMPEMMDSYTFATYFNDAYANANWGVFFDSEHLQRIKDYQSGEITSTIPGNGNIWADGYAEGNDNVDWYKAIYKSNTFSHEHNVSLNGGTEQLSYYASLNYLNQSGLMKFGEEGYDRYTSTAKINSKLTDWAKFNYSMRFTRTDYERVYS